MYWKINSEKRKKTGKRLIASFSGLIILSGMVALPFYAVGRGLTEQENISAAKLVSCKTPLSKALDLTQDMGRKKGGGESDIEALRNYKQGWQQQFSDCLKEYKIECGYSPNEKKADEYLTAVCRAVDAQNNLMEYLGMGEEEQLWCSAQIYQCALEKDIMGRVSNLLEGYGEFTNNIDQEFMEIMCEGNEEEYRNGQEQFNIDWSNQLCSLTLKFYEKLDEEGKRLANIWQDSREKWKEASSNCFWSGSEDICFQEMGADADRMEKDGWINRLYFLQLKRMMEGPLFSEFL